MLRHDEMLCYWLGVALRRVSKCYTEALAPYDVTAPQLFVLICLQRTDGLKPRQLADLVTLDASSLTGLLDRMQKTGLIERRQDPHDRRSLRITLTELGRARLEELEPLVAELQQRMMNEFLAGYGPDQTTHFLQMLRDLGRSGAPQICEPVSVE